MCISSFYRYLSTSKQRIGSYVSDIFSTNVFAFILPHQKDICNNSLFIINYSHILRKPSKYVIC